MLNRIIFYIALASVSLSLIRTVYDRLHNPSRLPSMPIATSSNQPAKDTASTPEKKSIAGMMDAMQQGMEAKQSGDVKKAEEKFHEGFQIAKELHDKQMVQGFIVLLSSLYIQTGAYDMAQAFLEVTKDKGDLDMLTYHSQRVYLFENQEKNKEMCTELGALEKLLSGLSCDTYQNEIKILLEGKDKARMMQIMQGSNATQIQDCIGKFAVKDKLEKSECTQQ